MEAIRKSGVLHPSVKGNYTDPHIIDSINKSLLQNLQEEQGLLARANRPVGPRTYEVNIAARPELMLDWDKPVSAQSPHVKDVLTKFGWDPESYTLPGGALAPRIGGPTGEDAYKNLARQMHNRYGQTDRGIQSSYASQELAEAGIPGIRYLDQGSRLGGGNDRSILQNQLKATQALHVETPTDYTTKEVARLQGLIDRTPPPTYNYVVTDPSKLDILAKYGVVGTAGGGMGALAAQDQYGAQP
jgi:hypothetical protein